MCGNMSKEKKEIVIVQAASSTSKIEVVSSNMPARIEKRKP